MAKRGEGVQDACRWRLTFEALRDAKSTPPIFITAAHRGEDTLNRRLLDSAGYVQRPRLGARCIVVLLKINTKTAERNATITISCPA